MNTIAGRSFTTAMVVISIVAETLVDAQADYDEHSTTSIADWQHGCKVNSDCTWHSEGTTCNMQNSQCIPPNGHMSVSRTFNLQLYQWSIESKVFARRSSNGGESSQQCGNRWLDFYNACSNNGFYNGIGHCGKWDATAEKIGECATSSDSSVSDKTIFDFCSCLCSTIIPAATDAKEAFYYRNQRCNENTPTLEEAAVEILRKVCPDLNPTDCSDNLTTVRSAARQQQEAGALAIIIGVLLFCSLYVSVATELF